MGKKKEELGKGIRALLSGIDQTKIDEDKKEAVVEELSKSVAEIPINQIEANPYQPRTEFKDKDLLELTQSIKTYGIIQPITVRKIGNKFQIISGERRWRASKLAGLKSMPAYIRIADDQGMLEMALVENIQRANLNAIEVAISYHRLMEECELNHEELADRVGKERSTVSNYVRLLKLPPPIQKSIKEAVISMGHARALSGIDDNNWQLLLHNKIIEQGLSVRASEALVKEWKSGKKLGKSKSSIQQLNPEINKIRDRLINQFGLKVDIKRNNKGKGQFVFHFGSDDQFNQILDIIENA